MRLSSSERQPNHVTNKFEDEVKRGGMSGTRAIKAEKVISLLGHNANSFYDELQFL